MAALLETRAVTKQFGGLTAVKALTLKVERGALYGLIGPNGAGKTTVFNLLTGVYDATDGEMLFEGASIGGRKPYEITGLGIARTFQNIRLFPDLSVLENVMTARHLRSRQTLADAILGTSRHHEEEREIRTRSMALLEIFDLQHVAGETATSLPYGSQRRLEIARALAAEPSLLLLDEPAAGMNPKETHEITELIAQLRTEGGYTILVIEHDMHVVEGISDRVVALDHGIKIAEGTFEAVATDPRVVEAYLGTKAAATK
jgi:branched-chain amino acid transport system ATP-binding protein